MPTRSHLDDGQAAASRAVSSARERHLRPDSGRPTHVFRRPRCDERERSLARPPTVIHTGARQEGVTLTGPTGPRASPVRAHPDAAMISG